MTRLWQALAVMTLGVAAYESLLFCQEVVADVVFAARTGLHTAFITTELRAIRDFAFTIGSVGALGGFAARRLRESSPPFARCGRAAAWTLLVVGALWIALVASPLGRIAHPCF
jgi:hypothetical protein